MTSVPGTASEADRYHCGKVLTNFSERNIGVPERETAPRELYLSAADAKRGLIRFEHALDALLAEAGQGMPNAAGR